MVIIMEPDDNQQQQCSQKLTKMTQNHFISENSDNLHSVEEIQTSRRRRKRTMSAAAKASDEEHQCSSSTRNRTTLLSSWSNVSSSSTTSSSSSPLVLFILASALLLFLCITPSHSLPFDGRRSLSSSSGGSSSHRSHMDLLIDPIHQAEYGDDDPFENKRIVKSVFDMVLRTPPPPTTSSSRCPPGTQSPFEGGPCIKKSTDPVAFVDQSFLLDTLRGLAQEGALMRGPQKTRRPGSNRRRPSGRPGSRTTSTTTTAAPSTTVSSEEDESASTTTFTTTGNGGGGVAENTGDNNANVVEEIEEAVITVPQETSPSPSLSSPVGETTIPATQEVIEEEAVKTDAGNVEASTSVTTTPDEGDTTTIIATVKPEAPEDSSASVVVTSTTTTTPTTPTTTEESVKDGASLRRTAEPEMAVSPSSSSPSSTGNGKKSSPSSSSSSNENKYYSSFQFPFLSQSSVLVPSTPAPTAQQQQNSELMVGDDQGRSEIYNYNTSNEHINHGFASIAGYPNSQQNANYQNYRRRHLNTNYNGNYYNNYGSSRRSRRRLVRRNL